MIIQLISVYNEYRIGKKPYNNNINDSNYCWNYFDQYSHGSK